MQDADMTYRTIKQTLVQSGTICQRQSSRLRSSATFSSSRCAMSSTLTDTTRRICGKARYLLSRRWAPLSKDQQSGILVASTRRSDRRTSSRRRCAMRKTAVASRGSTMRFKMQKPAERKLITKSCWQREPNDHEQPLLICGVYQNKPQGLPTQNVHQIFTVMGVKPQDQVYSQSRMTAIYSISYSVALFRVRRRALSPALILDVQPPETADTRTSVKA